MQTQKPTVKTWVLTETPETRRYQKAMIRFLRLMTPKKKPWNPLEKPIGVIV